MKRTAGIAFGGVLLAAIPMLACAQRLPGQRLPVLHQIELPHSYYYREMYLPQLTSGPASLAWSPDSRELVFAMAGSLWRQAVEGRAARQLTADRSYDYQPDWSPDGRWIVYSSYRNDSVELWALEVASGATHPLLQNGGVNVEPRFSPDGRRLVFVSTSYKGHFHVFTADFADGKLTQVEQLTPETRSSLPRYYYSPFDHEISPVWSRDGQEILYISNRNHIYGTGGFWRMAARAGSPAREIHYEETNWRARPDISPDGSRVVWGSYLGRSWHSLWVMPAGGGDAFPITYGDFDQVSPRWAPDGTRIAFISNRTGNTSIEIVTVPGGELHTLSTGERQYLQPQARLHVSLRDHSDRPAAGRVSVTDVRGLFHAPANAWIHADDGFDRKERPFEAHYFHLEGDAWLDVPAGTASIEVMQGFGRPVERRSIKVEAGQTADVRVDMDAGRWAVPAPGHWVSGDVHVHMNYGGTYRNDPVHLAMQARAENLNIVESLIVNKEQRFPDIAYNGVRLDPASGADNLIVHGQEYHTSYWGHLGLLGIQGGIILPGYVGYPGTAASSLYPSNADIADIAHAKGSLVGYVHPFDTPAPDPADRSQSLTDELPIDVALGKVDYIEALGFSDHFATSEVWYRLLNLGFRVPAAGGTDAMANYASLRGPVGMNRVYARVPDGDYGPADFLTAIKAGHTFATNGPLLGFTLADAGPGDELHLDSKHRDMAFTAHLRSIVPVDKLEVICNGRVARSLLHSKPAAAGDFRGTVTAGGSGWCVLRASTAGSRHPVLDDYVFATTSPVYFDVDGARARSPSDVEYFLAWIDRVTEAATAYPDWNNAGEKAHVLAQLAAARAMYQRMR